MVGMFVVLVVLVVDMWGLSSVWRLRSPASEVVDMVVVPLLSVTTTVPLVTVMVMVPVVSVA